MRSKFAKPLIYFLTVLFFVGLGILGLIAGLPAGIVLYAFVIAPIAGLVWFL